VLKRCGEICVPARVRLAVAVLETLVSLRGRPTRAGEEVIVPVVPVASPPVASAAVLRTAPASDAAGGGFEAVLGTRLRDARLLPSVSLGQMVDALAGRPSSGASSAYAPPGPSPLTGTSAVSGTAGPAGPGSAVLAAGERYLGVPYRWGGTDPATGFDCSGLVQQAFADVGVRLPRVSVDQARAGTEVAGGLAEARPGDLVFWRGDGRRPNHIGIYAGEGRMLVAPRTGDVVRYQTITRAPDAVRRIAG
jgi:peptidoglycan DL-endopeptidase CwlO